MKSETKKNLFFLFLVFAYTLQALVKKYEFNYIYFLGFVATVALLYVIKNKYLGAITGTVILVAMDFHDTKYKYLTILAFLLICAHKTLMADMNNKDKSNKNSSHFSFLCVQLTIFATVALSIYSFILIADRKFNIDAITLSRAFMIMFCLVAIFVYSITKNFNGKHQKNSAKINKQLSDSLRFIYLVSIFSFLATVLYYNAQTEYTVLHYNAQIEYIDIPYEAVYLPWFVYLCSTMYNNDPYVASLVGDIEAVLTKISNKK